MKAKIVNEETKEVSVAFGSKYPSDYNEMEVEQAYNGAWYVKGYVPSKPIPTIQEQIISLENTITARNIRNAIQGDEYALNKINEVEAQIQQLRGQLDK